MKIYVMNNYEHFITTAKYWLGLVLYGDSQMKARDWTNWERYLPLARPQTGAGTRAAILCLRPEDLALPEEGIEERIGLREPAWRPWEQYIPEEMNRMALSSAGERPEKVRV